MHGYDCAPHIGREAFAVSLEKREIGNGSGIVVFQSIRVETGKMCVAGSEREVGMAIHGIENMGAVGQTVMVTDQTDVWRAKFLQLVTHPLKLSGGAEIGQVATVNDKINVVAGIDASDG